MKNLLRRLALKSNRVQKHAVLILRGGALLSFGYNKDQRHAEDSALRKIDPEKRRNLTLVSIRVGRAGEFKYARPCFSCMTLLQFSGVKRIIYSDYDGGFTEERL